MDGLTGIFSSPEFWVGLSLVAAALPGPQTRIFPMLFKAIAKVASEYKGSRGN